MRQAVPLFLEDDTLAHIDWLAEKLSRKKNAKISRSDAVSFLVRAHWMQVQKRRVAQAVPA